MTPDQKRQMGVSAGLQGQYLEDFVNGVSYDKPAQKGIISTVASSVGSALGDIIEIPKRIMNDPRNDGDALSTILSIGANVPAALGSAAGKLVNVPLDAVDAASGGYFSGKVKDSTALKSLGGAMQSLDQSTNGVASDILDISGLAVIPGATNIRKIVPSISAPRLSDVFKKPALPASISEAGQTAVDGVIQGAAKLGTAAQKIPTAIKTTVQNSSDRTIVRAVEADTMKAADDMVSLYRQSVVPGVKGKKKTLGTVDMMDETIKEVLPKLAEKYDITDIYSGAEAVTKERELAGKAIGELAASAGEKVKVDFADTVSDLIKLQQSERAKFNPELFKALDRAIQTFSGEGKNGARFSRTATIEGTQQIISDINSSLEAFRRGATTLHNSDVVVNLLLKESLDEALNKRLLLLTGNDMKEVKKYYAQVTSLEKDLVHRAIFQSQRGAPLASQFADIVSAGDITSGFLTLNPTFIARGVAQYATKEALMALGSKDELFRQAAVYAKEISRAKKNISAPKPKPRARTSSNKSTMKQPKQKPLN